MIKLCVDKILKEQGKSNYWLMKELNMCYRNYTNMITGVTQSIRYETLDKMCKLLNVTINNLLIQTDDENKETNNK